MNTETVSKMDNFWKKWMKWIKKLGVLNCCDTGLVTA